MSKKNEKQRVKKKHQGGKKYTMGNSYESFGPYRPLVSVQGGTFLHETVVETFATLV